MEIEKCFKRLLIKNPFYGLFCLSLPKEITRKADTMRVVKQGINCCLQINPDFWEEYTDDEQLALIQHELGHIALQHMFISDSFSDHQIFNIAADAEVNSYIENLPKDGVTPAWISQKIGKHLDKGLGTKKYYEEIQDFLNKQQKANAQSPQKPCNGGQRGQSSQNNSQNSPSNSQNPSQNSSSSSTPSQATPDEGQQNKEQEEKQNPPSPPQEKPQSEEPQESDKDGSQDQSKGQQERECEKEEQYPEEFNDVHSYDSHDSWKDFKNLPEATQQLIQNNLNSILKSTAEEVEKQRGTIPGEFRELIEKLREKKPEVFNWKAYFRRLLGSIYDVNIKSTRRKESKRFAGSAGIQHKKKVSILVAVDTSGSVSTKELQEFFSEIDYVYKAGARVTILQCDTRINAIEEYDGKNIPEIKGRGGTSFDPPVDYYVKHKKEYASLIFFTDGEAPLPQKKPQGMVWVISSCGYHQDYFGRVIYIPKTVEQ